MVGQLIRRPNSKRPTLREQQMVMISQVLLITHPMPPHSKATRSVTSWQNSHSRPKAASLPITLTRPTKMLTLLPHISWAWNTAISSQSVMVMARTVEKWVAYLSIAYHIMLRHRWKQTWVSMISVKTIHRGAWSTNLWKKLSLSHKRKYAGWPKIPGIVGRHVLVWWPLAGSCTLQMLEIPEVLLFALQADKVGQRVTQPTSAHVKLSPGTISQMIRMRLTEFYKTMAESILTETNTANLLVPYVSGWRVKMYPDSQWHVLSEMP